MSLPAFSINTGLSSALAPNNKLLGVVSLGWVSLLVVESVSAGSVSLLRLLVLALCSI